MISSLCQSHHSILAASVVLRKQAGSIEHYLSWLEHQLELQLAALTGAQEESASQGEQRCIACSLAVEVGSKVIDSNAQGLRQGHDIVGNKRQVALSLPLEARPCELFIRTRCHDVATTFA